MAKKNFNSQSKEKDALGKLISKSRVKKGFSLRKFAENIGLSPSNMTYIEKGINAPTAEVYERILKELKPGEKEKNEMDRLFCLVRKVPTPEVCQVILNNYELVSMDKVEENGFLNTYFLYHKTKNQKKIL